MPAYIRAPAEYDHDKPLHVNRYRDRGSVRCNCGAEHDLGNGDTACDDCGQWFNTVGQQLVPRDQWEEAYDDY